MAGSRTRGQPVLALVLIMAGWIGARGYAWESAFTEVADLPDFTLPFVPSVQGFVAAPVLRHPARPAPAWAGNRRADAPGHGFAPLAVPPVAPDILPPRAEVLLAPPPAPAAFLTPVSAPEPAHSAGPPSDTMRRIHAAAGHQSMWLAATALMPLPPLGIGPLAAAPRAPIIPARRWSGDGWVLLRRNPAGLITPGPLPGTYGASQVGAVIRYRLDTTSANRPSAYVRAAAALGTARQEEAVLGLSARPLRSIPLVAMAEARASRSGSAIRVRPAVALVTELPPQALPFGFTGEAYAQGGYIGGRGATAFVDGLVRAERPMLAVGGFSLKAGGGAWAAGQRGASRVDVGPVASVAVRLTHTASARIEADWRFRVRGRAKPDSGPALTISAGF